jgi:hypothetical protein
MSENRINVGKLVQIPFEAYFPQGYGAILKDYKPLKEYVENPVTKVKEPGAQIGMTVVALSPFMAFEPVSVKIVGDDGEFTYPDLAASFRTGDFVYIGFDDFAGSSYSMNNTTHFTGTASRVYLVDGPGKTPKAAAPSTPSKPKAAAGGFPDNVGGFPVASNE